MRGGGQVSDARRARCRATYKRALRTIAAERIDLARGDAGHQNGWNDAPVRDGQTEGNKTAASCP